jgi:hypothetical protein
MDADALGPEAAALQRAHLHVRGGKRRLRQGKVAAGLVTLYDALLSAMDWYFESPERRAKLLLEDGESPKEDSKKYAVLVRSGVIDGSFNFNAFDELVEEALERDDVQCDWGEILRGIEAVMTRMGVIPFDEADLPPEDPCTF